MYQIVTDKVIERIENGKFRDFSDMYHAILTEGPCNYETGRPYSWLNAILLMHTGKTPEFITYNGIKRLAEKYPEKDIHLNKGCHGYIVSIFTPWGARTKKTETPDVDPETDDGKKEKKPAYYFSYYTVFSVDDVNGLDPKWQNRERPVVTDDACENLVFGYIKNEGINLVRHNYDTCSYSPSLDRIHLFTDEGFRSVDHKYKAAFHEMAHSTGNAKRLNRKLAAYCYDKNDYSKEELIADLAAAYLMAEYRNGGLTEKAEEETAFYLASWLKVIKEDPKLLIYSMTAAEKAANYIKDHATAAE